MESLHCANIKFSLRLIRRNNQLSWCLMLVGYFLLSKLVRSYVITGTDTSQENLRMITVKPGLIQEINATEPQFPSSVDTVYILENKTLCSSTKEVNVVVMVYTAPTNFDRRSLMRQTWLNKNVLSSLGSVKVVFLIGKVYNATLQSGIEDEFKTHGDILQGDFLDTYENLTLKGIMGLKWLSENCQHAELLVKADDDIVINTYRFFNEIVPEMVLHNEQVFCWRSPRSIIFRGIKHKSYMPKNYFHGMHSYPLYCKGPFVFMTFDLVSLILKSASLTPFIWLEDVYLYGVVMQNIPGIIYKQFRKGVDFDLEIENVMKCFNDTSAVCEMFVAGVSKTDEMMPVWTAMLKLNEQKLSRASW